MGQQLITKPQLAKRWEISIPTLNKRIKEGLISPVGGTGHPRFNMDDVLRAEGSEVGKLSPFERRRLEREKAELEQRVTELEEERDQIRRMLTNTVAELSQTLREV